MADARAAKNLIYHKMGMPKFASDVTKKTRSAVVKKAKKGMDIGKKGKMFGVVAAKAAQKYGSAEAGKRVAAAAMWKNLKGRQ